MVKNNSKAYYAWAVVAVVAVAIFLGGMAMSGFAIKKAPTTTIQPAKVITISELTQADYDFLENAQAVGEVTTETYSVNGITTKFSSQSYRTDNGETTTTYSCSSSCSSQFCYPTGCDIRYYGDHPSCSPCLCKENGGYLCGSSDGVCDSCKVVKTSSPIPGSSPASR